MNLCLAKGLILVKVEKKLEIKYFNNKYNLKKVTYHLDGVWNQLTLLINAYKENQLIGWDLMGLMKLSSIYG